MTDHYDEQIARAAERGLRPSRARVCMRVVAGRRCLWASDHPRGCQGCRNGLDVGLVWDHPRIWLDATGRHVLTLEPYDYGLRGEEEFDVVRAAAAELGLTVTVEPPESSLYYPGHTHLITITRAA